jgi:hypothetical protein
LVHLFEDFDKAEVRDDVDSGLVTEGVIEVGH